MDDKIVDFSAHKKGRAETEGLPVTTIICSGIAEPSASYLIGREGESLAGILSAIDASLMVRLFESDEVMADVAKDSRPQVRELLRRLFENLEKTLRRKSPEALPFLPGVDQATHLLSPASIVAALRIFLSLILPKVSNRQLLLMTRAVSETVASLDRLAFRSSFRDAQLIQKAFQGARLESSEEDGAPYPVVQAWLSEWASMPLVPMVADDFEFLRRFIRHLPEKQILAEDEWRALFRSLALVMIRDSSIPVNDRSFALFRLLARCARRLPFVQYLRHSHGRALDLLGEELKDWVLVNTLAGESAELSRPFRLWLEPEMVAEEAGLEPDELKDFFDGLIEKMRFDRERFELDWFEEATGALQGLLLRQQAARQWRESAFQKAETLASNIAADSSRKVSVSEMEAVIQQVCELAARVVTVAERPRDAEWQMAFLLSAIVDFKNDNHVWRNGQRIAASLSNLAQDMDEGFIARLQAALSMLQPQQLIHSNIHESLGPELARLEIPVSMLGCNLALFHTSSMTNDNARKSAYLPRDEMLSGRIDSARLQSDFADGDVTTLASLLGMSDPQTKAISQAFEQQIRLARLYEKSTVIATDVAGEGEPAGQHLAMICRLLFMLPAGLTDRIDEEWPFWVAPELRPLTRVGYVHGSVQWLGFEKHVQAAFPEQEIQRVQIFFKRVLASKKKKRTESTIELQPYHPLTIPRPLAGAVVSEPYRSAVAEFIGALEKSGSPQWLVDFASKLQLCADEESAWLSIYPDLLKTLQSHGQKAISDSFDRAMLGVLEHLEPIARAHWFEILAEGRAVAQQLAIGHVWLTNADSLAEVVAPQMRAAMNNEPDIDKCIRDLGFTFEQMGKTLTEQPPVMTALELPRFWFQNVSPFVKYPPVLWRLVAIALRDATQPYLTPDMIVSVASWCHRFGEVACKLATSSEFAAKTLQAKGSFFSENKRDEIAWRGFISGLLVTAAYGESGRIPRSLLCQRLLEATPPLNSLKADQWQSAASAIIEKFRNQLDETILPGLVKSQAAVTEAFKFRDKMNKVSRLESDTLSWVRNRNKVGAQARWRRFAALTSKDFGIAHSAHISVSQLADWSLPDEPYVKSQATLYKTVFASATKIAPEEIRVGLLKRRAPPIEAREKASWRVRMIGYALGVAYGDSCCQRQCMVVARMGPMREWSYEAMLELMRKVDDQIYLNKSTHGSADDARHDALHDAWAASEIALRTDELAAETVQRWKPFGKSADAENKRCIRDISHLMKRIMIGAAGIQLAEGLDEWYESHVLQFIRDSVKEPFAQLPGQLTKTFRAQMPRPVSDRLENSIQPLRELLQKE